MQTTDTTPRVIFWAHYIDWIITGPLLIACLAMVSKSDLVTLVFMMGNSILVILASLIGAMTGTLRLLSMTTPTCPSPRLAWFLRSRTTF